MTFKLLTPRQALNKAFLKAKPNRDDIESFKQHLIELLDQINEKETEEFHKNIIIKFLNAVYYSHNHYINTKGRNDLVIHNGKDAKSTVGVIIETKKPTNKTEMLKADNLNSKAFQELVLYYLRERVTHNNLEVRYVVATNIYEWFIFDAETFEKAFFNDTNLVRQFEEFEQKRLSGKNTDFFYKEIAEPAVEKLLSGNSKAGNDISFAHFNMRDFEKILRNKNKEDDNKLIALYKLLSPEHLLKLPFKNDSNTLDKRFYIELLHIIGLTEVKEGSKKLIDRKNLSARDPGSLIENAITQLDTLNKILKQDRPNLYGATIKERFFNVGLELTITWINRVLFLKLLEAQLITYHKGDKNYSFLNINLIKNFDDLNSLFFQVLAKEYRERSPSIQTIFSKVPYLNSSLFEPTELEDRCFPISQLQDNKEIPVLSTTVLKDNTGKKKVGKLNTLEYLFAFLDAYDFSSEGSEEIQEENKTLISASVLGLIFEKINGYKDGSFFTPGFITMYMCQEVIRRAVIQKFNDVKGWACQDLDSVFDKIKDKKEANEIINSLKICDPAVGSGHFLVSALNEIIAIKSYLKVLLDRNGRTLRDYNVEVINDELVITDDDGKLFEYNRLSKESQTIQETLFHEKQTVIENCLFGVDINTNSVKICRLRLWIELLKNAYYKSNTKSLELETLPNIDVNIKCGNSLISRFLLDTDLSQTLKKSKISIKTYRQAVQDYRHAVNKEQKWEMEKLIASIKSNFRTEISNNDPKVKNLSTARGELNIILNQQSLFALSKFEQKKQQEQKQKLQGDVAKLEAQIEEIKSNKIYENAFEWRFEFPEILDEKGKFSGFDVIIANPPYGVDLSSAEKSYLSSKYIKTKGEIEIYCYFIELGLSRLIKSNGFFAFITTNTIYYLDKFSSIRNELLLRNTIISLAELEKLVFADAPDIVPAIYVIKKANSNQNIIQLYKSRTTGNTYDLLQMTDFSKNFIEQAKFQNKANHVFNLTTSNVKEELIQKISTLPKISDRYKVVYGIKTGDNEKFVRSTSLGKGNWKKCASSANNIKKYQIVWKGDYLDVSSKLAGLGNINYEQPKILVQYIRKLSMPTRLVCALDKQGEYYPLNNFSFIISDRGYSIELLLGLINSTFMNWYFSNCFVDYNIKPKYLEQLPMPELLASAEIEDIVGKIIQQKLDGIIDTAKLEQDLDKHIFKLYGLSPTEIDIITNE